MILVIFIIPIFGFYYLKEKNDDYDYDNYYYPYENKCSCMGYIMAFFWCIAYIGLFLSIGSSLFILTLFLGSLREKLLENVLGFKNDI
jgi:hypothetical protein